MLEQNNASQRKRRATDRTYTSQLYHIINEGDISMTLLLGGLGLILWAAFGIFSNRNDLDAFVAMFPHGNATFWIVNYIGCGIALWWLVAANYPPLPALLIGGWLSTLWGWSFFARVAAITTAQTGNATSAIYIILGLLIIQRYGKK